MNKKTTIWTLSLVIILLFPILLYTIIFKDLSISKDPIDWTIFADYFTGLLSPIFLLINIIVLIRLTYEVAGYNKKNTLSQMKYSALSLISVKLFSVTSIILNDDDKEKEILLLRNDINSFCNAYDNLFSEIDMQKYKNKFDQILESWLSSIESEQILNEFDRIRNKLIREIQDSIIN